MLYPLVAVFTALALSSTAAAARICGNSTTYPWRVSDARYDSAGSGQSDGSAIVAVSIVPTNRSYGTFFECVASWPEAWQGFENGADNIVWSDCIWAGNGFSDDTTVSFAMDWPNHTMYVSHTFGCSDSQGADGLATGIMPLDMSCATTEEGTRTCTLAPKASMEFTTKGGPTPQEPDTRCPGSADAYQSWQLEAWKRQYELPPGSSLSDPPKDDTGPAFALRNTRNQVTDSFNCTNTGKVEDDKFTGTCAAAGEASTSTVDFVFDRKLNMLTVNQSWQCDGASFDAVGVGYVQATCDRHGDLLTCTTGPIWIGTKTR
ncbi:hypothetical protein KVR01_013811 [Diaporthe batatas]|uniref:uncharacterized protein n=1 Tax=Diaporthe batatas TaxID=748121 RepID=UPI001D057CC3|nr:uncharacterized protein KVR01_013811 [Diaporthe batatas]KAG8156359.1 hypothetical protein KVR01_013811 [Diaporthe batatas]